MLAIERAAFDEWLDNDAFSSATLEEAIDHTLALMVSLVGSGTDLLPAAKPASAATPAAKPSPAVEPKKINQAKRKKQGKEGK